MKPKDCSRHLFSLPAHFFALQDCIICLLLIKTVIILVVLLFSFTPYFYILGSGKKEVPVRGDGLLPDPKYVFFLYLQITQRHYI